MLLSINDDIIIGLKNQNSASQKVIFTTYKNYARNYYLKQYYSKFGKSHCEDIEQQCFIALMERAHKLRGVTKPELDAFIKKIFRNEINHYMTQFVKSYKHTSDLSKPDIEFPIDRIADCNNENPEAIIVDRLHRNDLLDKYVYPFLKDKEMELLNLLMNDKDIEEIAEYFGVSLDNTRHRKFRLIKKIRALVNSKEAMEFFNPDPDKDEP